MCCWLVLGMWLTEFGHKGWLVASFYEVIWTRQYRRRYVLDLPNRVWDLFVLLLLLELGEFQLGIHKLVESDGFSGREVDGRFVEDEFVHVKRDS